MKCQIDGINYIECLSCFLVAKIAFIHQMFLKLGLTHYLELTRTIRSDLVQKIEAELQDCSSV
jgi:hypothetical protein